MAEATQQMSLTNAELDTNHGRQDARGRQSRKGWEEGARRAPGQWFSGGVAQVTLGLWFSGGVAQATWGSGSRRGGVGSLGRWEQQSPGCLGLQQRWGNEVPCSPSTHALGL